MTSIDLLGAEDNVLQETINKLEVNFRRIDIVGSFFPPVVV
jgi:UDP-N-acetyl-D-mannosaminuronic acid transferase (WecB/TagA/CpsF family)